MYILAIIIIMHYVYVIDASRVWLRTRTRWRTEGLHFSAIPTSPRNDFYTCYNIKARYI